MKKNLNFIFIKIVIVTISIFSVSVSFSCEFDTDCMPGNNCIKSAASLYGVCAGGINPGNDYDERPVYSSTDPNNTTGNTCSFDTDCGAGSKCLKPNGGVEGACIY